MIRQYQFTEILGWSLSRYEKFSACKRQYYYEYYARFDTEFGRSKIDSLKKLTSLALEVGNVVHAAIKNSLEWLNNTGSEMSREALLKYARRTVDSATADKRFKELYYHETPAIDKEALMGSVGLCLDNYLSSSKYQWILRNAPSNKAGWVIDPDGFGESRINGKKVYCKVDLLLPVGDNVHIVDWKTGKKEGDKHTRQLLTYTAWAHFDLNKKPENIFPSVVYLHPADEAGSSFTAADVSAFLARMDSETKEMYGFCLNADKNIPKEKSEFPKAANTAMCAYCNFRELCIKL